MKKKRYLSTLLALTIFSTAVFADPQKETQFLQEILEKVSKECVGSRNYIHCKAENTPTKCRALAFSEDLRPWVLCVRSCGNAGYFSQTFGECS